MNADDAQELFVNSLYQRARELHRSPDGAMLAVAAADILDLRAKLRASREWVDHVNALNAELRSYLAKHRISFQTTTPGAESVSEGPATSKAGA